MNIRGDLLDGVDEDEKVLGHMLGRVFGCVVSTDVSFIPLQCCGHGKQLSVVDLAHRGSAKHLPRVDDQATLLNVIDQVHVPFTLSVCPLGSPTLWK